MFWFILGTILWIIFAFWPAIVAKRKGYSFILFFIFSLFTFFISLIVALVLRDKTMTSADRAADTAAEKVLNKEESKA